MAYAGYRIQIGGATFPNHDMAKGSYTFKRGPRPSKTWEDLTGIGHEVDFPTDKAIITFSVRAHEAADHATLAAFFATRSVAVSYYDDNTGNYASGNFKIKDFSWKHGTVTESGPFYEATPVTLEEW